MSVLKYDMGTCIMPVFKICYHMYIHFEKPKRGCFDYLLFPNLMPNDMFLKHVGELCLGNIFSTLDLLHTYTIHFYVRLLVVRWVFSNHITMVVNLFAYNLFSENACFIAHHKFKYHTVQHRQQHVHFSYTFYAKRAKYGSHTLQYHQQ